tara:strand:+ start:300 stop:572 length:273 start_codon:yes stop_codon:yes gene_type:complete
MIDIEKSKKDKLKLKTPKQEVTMSHYELCRWFSLLEAVDIIDKKCETLGKDSDDINWVKPIAIQKYIDERTESMLFELKSDLEAEEQCTT